MNSVKRILCGEENSYQYTPGTTTTETDNFMLVKAHFGYKPNGPKVAQDVLYNLN